MTYHVAPLALCVQIDSEEPAIRDRRINHGSLEM